MLGIVASQRSGIYPRLAPGNLRAADIASWTQAAYSSWWANFDHSIFGWLAYFWIGYIGLYYIVTMNLIGGRVVLLLWQTRRLVSFGADPDDEDGYYGWATAREVLAATYTACAVHSVALLLVVLMVPGRSVWFLLPVAIFWLAVIPPYFLVPLILARRSVTRFKAWQESLLAREIASLRRYEDTLQEQSARLELLHNRELLYQRLLRVRRIPNLPFRRLKDTVLLILTVVTSAISIYGTLALWYNLT